MGNLFICPKCSEVKKSTRHHIYPRRWFGGSNHIYKICEKCHSNLERVIFQEEEGGKIQLPKRRYLQILYEFITNF